jgi:Zn-dependent protease with chaperone function
MAYLAGTFMSVNMGRELIVSATLLVLPLALALWFRRAAQQRTEEQQAVVWLGYRRLSRFIMAAIVASWWAIWDLNRFADLLPGFVPRLSVWLEPSSVETLLFWIPPIVSIGAFLVLAYFTDAAMLKLKWTFADVLRLVWWRLANFVVPLLMIATGFDDIFHGNLWGCAWIAVAGIFAMIGTIYFQKAEGMRLHEVKASETRNRALKMARRMGIELQRIYVVPAGRGHLTNAFGGMSSIGLTDSLGKYLDKQQIDFVIAHELAHVQEKHGRKKRLLTITFYSAMTLMLFSFRQELLPFRPMLDILIILVPLGTFYFLSRRYEYEADRRAVDFTGNPETAVRALAGLHRISAAPARCGGFIEMFQTHPALWRRADAIGRAGEIPATRIAEILRQEGNPENKREVQSVAKTNKSRQV